MLGTQYIGIFPDGTYTTKTHLVELLQVNYLKYMIKTVGKISPYNRYYYDSITLIDSSDKQTELCLGDFKLIDIADGGYAIIVLDIHRNSSHRITTEPQPTRFIHDQVLPILEKLNGFGSFLAYEVNLQNIELKKEIEALSEKVELLEAQINNG